MDPNIAIPHYPPPEYSWNEATESYYCDAASHCLMYPQSAQSIATCDNQCSMSNSLYEPHGFTEDHTVSRSIVSSTSH